MKLKTFLSCSDAETTFNSHTLIRFPPQWSQCVSVLPPLPFFLSPVIWNSGRKLPNPSVVLESSIPLFFTLRTARRDKQAHLSEFSFYIYTVKTCICSTSPYVFILFQGLIDTCWCPFGHAQWYSAGQVPTYFFPFFHHQLHHWTLWLTSIHFSPDWRIPIAY